MGIICTQANKSAFFCWVKYPSTSCKTEKCLKLVMSGQKNGVIKRLSVLKNVRQTQRLSKSFPFLPLLWYFPRWCGPVPAGPTLVPPSPTSGARGGPMRHGVKRKLRPLSRHKYHNSILNNASLLGRGLTHTGIYSRHKGKHRHINCCLSSTLL